MADPKAASDATVAFACPHCGGTIRATFEGCSKVTDGRDEQRPASPARRCLSRLDRDPEVGAFARELDVTHELTDIYEAIRERFGEARAPSRSALHRYLTRERAAAANTSA